MESLLMTIITFVGLMLVLALAAQSVQELIKAMFTIKGQTALRGLQGLIREAAAKEGQHASAPSLVNAVVSRLQGLGQDGVRKSAVRLDSMSKELLASLIQGVDRSKIEGLSGLGKAEAECILKTIADRAEEWYPLAMDPVDERYRRRMRGYALLSSAIVVVGLNADAWTILQRSRSDPTFQAAAVSAARRLDSLSQRVESDSASARLLRAELANVVGRDSVSLFGKVGDFQWGNPTWWVGIIASILLVSLGAPFWHDLLEALFGWKNKIRAQAKIAATKVPDEKKASGVG